MTTTTGITSVAGAIGSVRTRVEGRDKVTGAARYSGEVPFAELAHGWLVLSTVARGRILPVEDGPVLAMPGVLTVLHHGNAPRVDIDYVGMLGRPNPIVGIFQHDRVPFAGWPVALVVAETSEQAREAAEALVVEYDVEPHDVAFRAGRPDAYTPESTPMVQPETEKGDVEAQLDASAVVVDAEYTTPEEHHNPMEPHAATARWDGGRLRRRRLQPGQQLGGQRAGAALLPRSGIRAGAVGARRGRLRVEGAEPASSGGRDGHDRPPTPGPCRTDPPPDVLPHRLPQPHGAADQARCRRRRPVACARPPGAEPDVDRVRIHRVERRPGACVVRRRRASHPSPPRTARRSDPDVDACARRGTRVLRPGVGARRTGREVRRGPDRAPCTQ